ncbi:galactokinase [Nesidiocoris tenuis]|uniref:Galactokinase n=1 Tax=Nesidiocoris tenuis TaxID=355587 RepID=A0ABN7AMM3_9HEMI|nr:galactokinase [Nesidiocoris tenuis]
MTEDQVPTKSDPKNDLIQHALDSYKVHFAKPLSRVAVYAPAKVTILGDHTEYLGGFSLNMTLPLYTVAVGAPNNSHTIKVVDLDLTTNETQIVEFPIPPMLPVKKGQPEWANLVKAAVAYFEGLILEGFNVVFVSDIPRGYGLGSSTSLVVCAYTFLENITKEHTTNLLLKAGICSKAEQEFTGAPAPFADCAAIIMGQPDIALFIDCSKEEIVQQIPINQDRYAFLVSLISTKSRAVDSLEDKKKECTEGMSIVGVTALTDMQVSHLKVFKEELSAVENVPMRIRHVLSEHIRVNKAVGAMKENDYLHLGRLMNQSQVSTRYDFEISTDEVDAFVDAALNINGVLGTRLTGTSLGCSVISLIRKTSFNEVLSLLRRKSGSDICFIRAEPCHGAGDISSKLYILEKNEGKAAAGVFTQIEYGVEQYKLNFFGKEIPPTTATYAPGRVCVLGEHCDMNQGSVIQMAVPLGTTIVGAYNNTDCVDVVVEEDVAKSEPSRSSFALPSAAAIRSDNSSWTDLFRAVMWTFHGKILKGFDCVAVCSLPQIAGLGKTTSLIIAFYTFLECLSKDYISSLTCKAKRCFLAQEMVESGSSSIADHLTIITACGGCLTHVDSWNLDVKCLAFPVREYTFLLCDSNLEREGAGLSFPGHRNECVELQEILGPFKQLTLQKLKKAGEERRASQGMLNRGAHVVTEMTRVYQGLRAIAMKDMQAVGLLMLQSHNSLVENYEISHWNQKQLVALAMAQNGVLGSKMTNSDASSCTLTLVKREHAKEIIQGIRCRYNGHVMIYEVDPSEGTQDVTHILLDELAKKKEVLETFEVDLSGDEIEEEDLEQLSTAMFDLEHEWQAWERKSRHAPPELVEKSHESFKALEEVLSEESEDVEEEIDEEWKNGIDPIRKFGGDSKRQEGSQRNLPSVLGTEYGEISSSDTSLIK